MPASTVQGAGQCHAGLLLVCGTARKAAAQLCPHSWAGEIFGRPLLCSCTTMPGTLARCPPVRPHGLGAPIRQGLRFTSSVPSSSPFPCSASPCTDSQVWHCKDDHRCSSSFLMSILWLLPYLTDCKLYFGNAWVQSSLQICQSRPLPRHVCDILSQSPVTTMSKYFRAFLCHCPPSSHGNRCTSTSDSVILTTSISSFKVESTSSLHYSQLPITSTLFPSAHTARNCKTISSTAIGELAVLSPWS
jgi:hypothetical protein